MCMSRSMQVFRLKEEGDVCMCLCMCVCACKHVHARVQERDKDKQESWENLEYVKKNPTSCFLFATISITASGRCNG